MTAPHFTQHTRYNAIIELSIIAKLHNELLSPILAMPPEYLAERKLLIRNSSNRLLHSSVV